MAGRVLIACRMVEDAVTRAVEKLGSDIRIVWVERGLHEKPKVLHDILQREIDRHADADEILLSFGLCGCAAKGLVSKSTRLVMPRFDDCVNIMLYCGMRRSRALTQTGRLYLTREWTVDDKSILGQIESIRRDFEPDTAEFVIRSIYGGYSGIDVIDSGCYELEATKAYAVRAAGELGIECTVTEGSADIFLNLISGNYDSNILVKEPGEAIELSDFEVAE